MAKELRDIDRALSAAEARVERLASAPHTERAFGRYRSDPVRFVREVLRGESATRRSTGAPYQFEVLAALAEVDHVSVRSGHGVGKSTLAAWAILWWLFSRPESLAVVAAPTADRQGRGIVGREVLKWAQRGRLTLDSDGLGGWRSGNTGSRLVVVSGASEVGLVEGQHADATLLVLDECKALGRDTIDALSGALTGTEGRILAGSTPGAPSGFFFDVAREDGDGDWRRFHIPSDDSSQVSERWVNGRARAWGVQSATYQQRVRGEFPRDGGGALCSWALLHASVGREIPPSARVAVSGTVLGLDVARSLAGDASAAVLVRDGAVVHAETWREATLTATAGRALDLVRRFRPDAIVVDEGGVGGGLVDRLREVVPSVRGVHFGQRAADPDRFVNARAEAYWTLRVRLEAGALSLPDSAEGRDELLPELAAQRVVYDARGRVGLAPKDAIRGELGRSPDLADALALSVYAADDDAWRPPSEPAVFTLGLMDYQSVHAPGGPGAELADAWGLTPVGDPLRWLPHALGGLKPAPESRDDGVPIERAS